MQVEVDPSVGKHTGGLYESGGRGWVKMPTAEGEQALKVGQWNDLEVAVAGNHMVTQLNGVKIVDYTDTAPKFTDGVIGLQDRKSTRLNSSHLVISYAVFCLKTKTTAPPSYCR